ncbi:ankyrin repeat-containing domain protein [Lactarius hengduanensis]|nr:ankyrin repeat-containing domain protein [Lactarius hengduanensis]
MALAEVLRITHSVRDGIDEIQWNQLKELLRAWLSPADPLTNHNIARKAQHKGTAVWFFQGSIFIEWKSTGSLLWIHGKPGSGSFADYVRNVVDSSPSIAMRRWRAEDKNLVIETLTERGADGMFRWVGYFASWTRCDIASHRTYLRQFLNELPETLDETYERILRGITKAQKDNAHRLLQCLAVAVRPLRVEELAELLAFDFQASSSGGIPKFKEDWRWEDQEEAVLSTCSGLITVVHDGDSQVVQFSHFSVKEYLTSLRLERSNEDIARFHIHFERAHATLAQACLGTLLRLDECGGGGNNGTERFPLTGYAAQHWVDHAQFEQVSSRIRDGMDDLFDLSKPHFAAWIGVHDIGRPWFDFSHWVSPNRGGSPLYYAAFCGFYDLTERLINKYPEQVHATGGRILAPLPAALCGKHFRVADLLHQHGASLNIRGEESRAPLHTASMLGVADIAQWLLKHNADVNCRQNRGWTPLHLASYNNSLEVIEVLFNHNADVNSLTEFNQSPLSLAIDMNHLDVVRFLLENGADADARTWRQRTPLYLASSQGWLEVARLLLEYGADVDAKDDEGTTPFQIASARGHHEITKLLSKKGSKPEP